MKSKHGGTNSTTSPSESIDLDDLLLGRVASRTCSRRSRCGRGLSTRPAGLRGDRVQVVRERRPLRAAKKLSNRTFSSPSASSSAAARRGVGCRPTRRAAPGRSRPSGRRSTPRSRTSSSAGCRRGAGRSRGRAAGARRGPSRPSTPFAPGNRPEQVVERAVLLDQEHDVLDRESRGDGRRSAGSVASEGLGVRSPGSPGRQRCTRLARASSARMDTRRRLTRISDAVVGSSATGYGERGMGRQECWTRRSR